MELDCWISLLKITMSKVEQTLSLIKPDAVERNLDEEIKQFFIKSGFIIAKQKKGEIRKKGCWNFL